jgi:hypothetical protein
MRVKISQKYSVLSKNKVETPFTRKRRHTYFVNVAIGYPGGPRILSQNVTLL